MVIKAITFDLWNTILCDRHYDDHRVDLLARALEKEGFPMGRAVIMTHYTSAQKQINSLWEERKDVQYMSARNLMKLILEALNVELPNSTIDSVVKELEEIIWKDPPSLMNGVEEVLSRLRARGLHRLGLISNSGVTPGRVLRKVLEHQQILGHFQCIIFSDEVGYTKPHCRIFLEALKDLRVKAEEAVHVGDLIQTDVAGDKALGMKTVWFDRDGKVQGEIDPLPNYEIETLTQLLTIVKDFRTC